MSSRPGRPSERLVSAVILRWRRREVTFDGRESVAQGRGGEERAVCRRGRGRRRQTPLADPDHACPTASVRLETRGVVLH